MRRSWKFAWVGLGVAVLLLMTAGLVVYTHPLWVLDQQTRMHLWRSGVKSRYVTIDGERVHYFEASALPGSPGTPLVLIHGLGARAEDWSALIPGLAAAGFHVYVPDLLGYGRSAHPDANYSISMQQTMIERYMRAMGVERADVVGWSMGGWVAMKLALDDAPMVDRLVLFDAAGVYFPGYTKLLKASDVKDVEGVKQLLAMLTPNAKKVPVFVERDLARRIKRNSWVIQRSLAAMTGGHDLLDFRLYAIKQPTLVVWGEQDALIPLSSGQTIHKGIAGSTMLVVNGCGHLTPAECWKPSLAATVQFLRAQPAMHGGESVVEGQ